MCVHVWCHEKATMHPCYVLAWTTFSLDIHVLCNLPCAMHEITAHGVATRVTATQGTCLNKYLTTP